MMTPMSRPQFAPVLAVGLLILIWTTRWQMLNLSSGYSWVKGVDDDTSNSKNPHQISTGHGSTSPQLEGHGLVHPLATEFDLSDPDAPFIGWPLKRACDEVEDWVEGVTFLCDNNFGGVGNVRNFILTCIRYAIEAGATGIVMPGIRKRKDDDIKIIFDSSDIRPFNYLFDEVNFRQAMGENCPQLTIYDDWTKVPHIRYLSDGSGSPEVQKIDPRQMDREWGDTEKCDFAELDHQTDRFGSRFRQWVTDPAHGIPPSKINTRLFRGIDWPGVLWEWPVFRDGPELANTFGGLCKFNRTMMRLGKKALANMQIFAREQRSHSHGTKSKDEDASKFLGVHLRTEADAEPFWPTYKEQEEAYLDKADELGLSVGYVASGNLTEAHKFAKAAKQKFGMALVSKDDLLDEEDLEELHSLSWDQQGLVDYIVLAGAEYFTGNSRSSFSISMCQKRQLKMNGLYSRPYKLRPNGYERSFVVGPMDKYYDHWLFIWDAMWP